MSESKMITDINEKMNILCYKYVNEKKLEPNYVNILLELSLKAFQDVLESINFNFRNTEIFISRRDAYPIIHILLEFFPSSKIDFKSNHTGDNDGIKGIINFNISETDRVLNKEVISAYSQYMCEKHKKIFSNKIQISELYEQIRVLNEETKTLELTNFLDE